MPLQDEEGETRKDGISLRMLQGVFIFIMDRNVTFSESLGTQVC